MLEKDKIIGLTDMETGEAKQFLIEGTSGLDNPSKVRHKDKDLLFCKILPLLIERFPEDIKSGKLHTDAFAVFMWIVGKIMYGQVNVIQNIPAPHDEIAVSFGFSERAVSKHCKDLVRLDYITQHKPRQQIYQVNPDMAFRGILETYYRNMSKKAEGK